MKADLSGCHCFLFCWFFVEDISIHNFSINFTWWKTIKSTLFVSCCEYRWIYKSQKWVKIFSFCVLPKWWCSKAGLLAPFISSVRAACLLSSVNEPWNREIFKYLMDSVSPMILTQAPVLDIILGWSKQIIDEFYLSEITRIPSKVE